MRIHSFTQNSHLGYFIVVAMSSLLSLSLYVFSRSRIVQSKKKTKSPRKWDTKRKWTRDKVRWNTDTFPRILRRYSYFHIFYLFCFLLLLLLKYVSGKAIDALPTLLYKYLHRLNEKEEKNMLVHSWGRKLINMKIRDLFGNPSWSESIQNEIQLELQFFSTFSGFLCGCTIFFSKKV